MSKVRIQPFIFSGLFVMCLFVLNTQPAQALFGLSSRGGDDGSSYDSSRNYSSSFAVYTNDDTGEYRVYSSWSRADDGFGSVSAGNWESGNGTWSGSNSSAAGNYPGGDPSNCTRIGVIVTCPTTTWPPYIPPADVPPPDDTPTVGPGTTTSTDPRVTLYIQKQGTTGWSKSIQVTPSDEVALRWVVSNANYCQSKDTTEFSLTNTGGVSGTTNTVEEPETGTRNYAIECRNSLGTTVESLAGLTILATPLEFTAAPKLIRSKETSKLIWNVHGRTGCTIAKKANGEDSSTVSTDAGSRTTEVLTGETTYRLSCPDGSSADATIQVLPVISET